MKCPHCQFDAADDEKHCPSCGYALTPPAPPPARKISLIAMGVILLFFIGLFISVVLAMRDSTGSAINYLGHRAYYDFPPDTLALGPGERKQYSSIRLPARTPLCRINANVSASGPGVDFIVLDSTSFAGWAPGSDPRGASARAVSEQSSVSIQAEGGGVVYHMIFRLREAANDTARVIVRRLQANCYEKW